MSDDDPRTWQKQSQKTAAPASALPYTDVLDAFGAAFMQKNPYVVWWNKPYHTMPKHPEAGFNAFNRIAGTKYEPHWRSFVNVYNSQAFDMVTQWIDGRRERAQRLAATPLWLRGPALLMAGMADVTVFAPGGWIVRTVRPGLVIPRMRVTGGAFPVVDRIAAADTKSAIKKTAKKMVLQDVDDAPEGYETVEHTDHSFWFGSILAGGKALAPRQWNAAMKALKSKEALKFGAAATGAGAAGAGAAIVGSQLTKPYPTNRPTSDSEAPEEEFDPRTWPESGQSATPDSSSAAPVTPVPAPNPMPPKDSSDIPWPDPGRTVIPGIPGEILPPSPEQSLDNKTPAGTEEE